jgi:hypothetical protein
VDTTGFNDEEHANVREMFSSILDLVLGYSDRLDLLVHFVEERLDARECKFGTLIPVPTLTFSFTKGISTPIPVIMVPFDWNMQGLLADILDAIRVCSQMTDYFHGVFIGQTDLSALRAEAYQAEWVKTTVHFGAEARNPRMLDLIQRYPEGLDSPHIKHLVYILKPYISLND